MLKTIGQNGNPLNTINMTYNLIFQRYGGGKVASFEYIRSARQGEKFRDWLVEVLADKYETKTVSLYFIN